MRGIAGKRRNAVLVWLVWPLITFGVYSFVFWYKINREARDFDERIEVDPVLSLMAVLFGPLIVVPPFVSVYNTGDRINRMQEAAGLSPSCNPWIGLILTFLFGLHTLYYQMELNRIWDHYGDPGEGGPVTLAALRVESGALREGPSPASPRVGAEGHERPASPPAVTLGAFPWKFERSKAALNFHSGAPQAAPSGSSHCQRAQPRGTVR